MLSRSFQDFCGPTLINLHPEKLIETKHLMAISDVALYLYISLADRE
jgi:hypothetical protein